MNETMPGSEFNITVSQRGARLLKISFARSYNGVYVDW